MRTRSVLLITLLITLWYPSVWALDHDNLDKNRPVQVEDAYPIAMGEIGLEGGVQFEDRRRGLNRWEFRPQILYGAFYNTQLEVEGGSITGWTSGEERETSGNLGLGALYNFNTETISVPALAVKIELEVPTGESSEGLDMTVGGLLTRSFGRWRTHLNLEYTVVGATDPGERNRLYTLISGISYPLGYPMRFRETLIVDVFIHQSEMSGEENITGVEIGIRHQISPRVVLDGGIGTELSGPDDLVAIFGTVGLSMGF